MQFTEKSIRVILCYVVSSGVVFCDETIERLKKHGLIKPQKRKLFKGKINIEKHQGN